MKQHRFLLLAFVGLLAVGGGILFVARRWEQKQPPAPQSQTGTSALRLQFQWTDDSVTQQPDNRSGAYTFAFQEQSIGVLELSSREASSTAFATWARGLNGTIKVGEMPVSSTLKMFGERTALLFTTTEGGVTAHNMMTQYGGVTVWIQTRAPQTILETFSERIASITRT
jgi:hypothetical protein